MKTHECIRCGNCCTDLEPSKPGVPGGLLLTFEESLLFRGKDGKDVIPTVAYTLPGEGNIHILYYGMVNTLCPLYDNGCTVYENRPLTCRRYPLGNSICDPNKNCPAVVNGGVLFNEETLDAMFELDERAMSIMRAVPKGSILYIYNIENEKWDIIGVR